MLPGTHSVKVKRLENLLGPSGCVSSLFRQSGKLDGSRVAAKMVRMVQIHVRIGSLVGII